MIKDLQENSEKWKYCWLFQVGAMRNTHLKTVRKLWKDSARIFFGRSAVMAKALGTTPEEEHRMGLHNLAKQIQGQIGVLFTDTEPDEVIAWFADFQQPDFARQEYRQSDRCFAGGPVMRNHSDPPNRVPTLHNPHKLCEKGKPLTSEQAQLLKLIGEKMVVFRVSLISRWCAATGEVVQVEGQPLPEQLGDVDEDSEADAMDD
ncbi:hypothetical protein B0H13DRAFT_1969075 [Mycena leptocephala]|nr:hypothetical protein B0H13DRAFT_1969075 [Mycena leptocephala]